MSRWFQKPYAFLCSQISSLISLIYRLKTSDYKCCFRWILNCYMGKVGRRGGSQVDLLIISLTAEVNYFISPFPLG